jgi:hypothetical protein
MKKTAIGCLAALVVVGVAAGIGSYYVYRQVRSTVTQFAEIGSAAEIENGIRNQDPFSPPASGELTRAQVEQLVQVQSRVRTRLGERFAEMEARYKALADKTEPTAVDLPELIAAYRDLAASWVEGKRAQVDALNAAGLSLLEYRWVRGQAYQALGIPVVEIDVARIIEDVKSGQTGTQPGTVGGSLGPGGPEANRTLVEPYRKQLESSVALATLGL